MEKTLQLIQPKPWMDDLGFEGFQKYLSESRCYLEYGCGGSTIYACCVANVEVVISIDSDKVWIANVIDSLTASSGLLLIEHCDIGDVGEWGVPRSNERVNDFWNYMTLPWRIAKANNKHPDLILVDGRFRVASFLFSLISARMGTIIMFDDYMDRPEYFVCEDFCRLQGTHGRMGVFIVSDKYNIVDLCEKIAQYSVLWDS